MVQKTTKRANGKQQTQKIIQQLKKFKKNAHVDKLILFGSAAKGKMTEHSDIDLVLVSKKFANKKRYKRPLKLYDFWTLNYPVDFLCYTPEEFEKQKNRITIVREAVLDGIEI